MAIQIAGIAYIVGILLGPIIFRTLAALGIGVITYVGFDAILQVATEFITSNTNGIPADIINGLGFAQVDVYITLTFSSYIAALSFRTITRTIGVR